MSEEPIVEIMENFSLVGLVAAFFVFSWLAIRARSLGSFRFQLSIFMLIWISAEVPHIVETLGMVSDLGFGLYGLTLHMISMFSFALFVGARSYKFLRMPPLSLPVRTQVSAAPDPSTGELKL